MQIYALRKSIKPQINCGVLEYFETDLALLTIVKCRQLCPVFFFLTAGSSAKAFAVYLCYVYGAFVDLSNETIHTLGDLAAVADMYRSDELLQALAQSLKHNQSHCFHAPCDGEKLFQLSAIVPRLRGVPPGRGNSA